METDISGLMWDESYEEEWPSCVYYGSDDTIEVGYDKDGKYLIEELSLKNVEIVENGWDDLSTFPDHVREKIERLMREKQTRG